MLGHRHRHKRTALSHIFVNSRTALVTDGDQLTQTIQHLARISGLLADHNDPIILFIKRNQHAVAVKNQPSVRCQQANVNPVFLGQKPKLVRLVDLQLAHAPTQHANRAQLYPHPQQTTPRNAPLTYPTSAGWLHYNTYPNLLGRLSFLYARIRNTQCRIKTTNG